MPLTRTVSSLTQSRNKERREEVNEKSKLVVNWMQELLKEPIRGDTLQEKLSDGVVLCRVANALKPGCIRKFHRNPKMQAMKHENIGFFLTVARSRFNVSQGALFVPGDLLDPSENDAPILRVLTVLLTVIKEGGHNVAGLEGITQYEDDPEETTETTQTTQTTQTEAHADDLLSPRTNEPGERKQNLHIENSNGGEWYLQGKLHEYVDMQAQVASEILECIHQEMSIVSKLQLLDTVAAHSSKIQEKLLYATDAELRQLCYEMGLGNSLSDIPVGKDRKWYIEWIIKYGRAK